MSIVKCCLMLIATWTLYTQAKPTNFPNEYNEQDSNSLGGNQVNSVLISSRSSVQETQEEVNKLESKPKPHGKHSKSECFDGQGRRVREGVGCSRYTLNSKKGEQVCWAGVCRNGICTDVEKHLCSNS
uniref:Putative secreted peptide n=1 Tax=Rhipicephalus pulchellus TaxID=72859 RepID=L7MC42_RHIPC